MEHPLPKREDATDRKPVRTLDAPPAVWWMLAILAIIAFSALAFLLGRAT